MQQKWEALLGPAKVLFWNCFLNLSGTTLLLLKKECVSLYSESSLFPFRLSWLEGINSIEKSSVLEYNLCGFVILQLGKKSEVMVCFTWNDTSLIISGLGNVKDGRMFIAITKGPIIFF